MIQLFWLCVIGTLSLSVAFWYFIEDMVLCSLAIASLLLSSGIFAFRFWRGLKRLRRNQAHLNLIGPYLAFGYKQGHRNLVTTEDGRKRVDGQLLAFRDRNSRDAWVAEGPESGKRSSVSSNRLPLGWTILDAHPNETEAEQTPA